MQAQDFMPPADVAAEIDLHPAKFGDRFIAYVIDLFPFAAGFAATGWALRAGKLPQAARLGVWGLLGAWSGACLVYQVAGNLAGGQAGKRMMGLRVVRPDGTAPGPLAALARALGYALSTPFFNAGFLVALVHPDNRALDDLLSGTLVVEAPPKPAAESGLLFLCAAVVLCGLYGLGLYGNLNKPTPADRLAVGRAKQAMFVLAAVEDDYKARNGVYTQSLPDLSKASGNPAGFQSAMLAIFMPDAVQMTANGAAYRISAKARDRKRTRVTLDGPPPEVR